MKFSCLELVSKYRRDSKKHRLLIYFLLIRARLRSKYSTASRHKRRTSRTLSSVTSSFLLERLLTTTRDKSFCLSSCCTLTATSKSCFHNLVNNCSVNCLNREINVGL